MIDLAKTLPEDSFQLQEFCFPALSGFYSLGHQQLKPMHSLVGVEVGMGLCSKGILFDFLSKNGSSFQLIDGK